MTHVSVIIPTHNRERFVVKAIDSILNQTVKAYEIIVIDDGSTDGTQKALEAYANKIRCFYQANSGVSSARNVGIKEAQGEWVAFLDSDDEWTEDFLSVQMESIGKFPHVVAHITNAVTILPDGARSNHFAETKLLDRFKDNECLVFEKPLSVIVNHAPWFLQSSIVKRDILLCTGLFDEKLSVAEDLDVIARVALRGSFAFCARELVKIIRREERIENLSAQCLKRGIYRHGAFSRVYAGLYSYCGLSWVEKAIIARALSKSLRALGNALVLAGKRSEARQYYGKSFVRYPSVRSVIKYAVTFLPVTVSDALVRKGNTYDAGNKKTREKEEDD